jgi:hypothetical protein
VESNKTQKKSSEKKIWKAIKKNDESFGKCEETVRKKIPFGKNGRINLNKMG